MKHVVRWIDDLIDGIIGLFLVLLLLLGTYCVYDTLWVYYNASSDRVSAYKPGSEGELLPLSEDCVAWLTIDDTNIDHPIMQGETNGKYLNTDPYGEYSLSGSIFLDSRNAGDFSDSYSLVYGHHMADGMMFGALDAFFDEPYFDAHRTGTLTVGETVYSIDIFAALRTDAGEDAIFTPDGSETVLALAEEHAAIYRTPANDHVVALSTCQDAGSTSRTVVLLTLTETNE